MSRTRILLFLVATTALLGRVSAMPVSSEKALAVANTFWAELTESKADPQFKDRTQEWPFDAIHLFTRAQGGFVLVAADDAARPILGYSTSSTIDPANLPLPLAEWLALYQHQIEAARAAGAKAVATDAAEWHRLERGITRPFAKDGVGPLLTTLWDQQEPYNELCPYGTVTGCAATAQAQMMKYWNFPPFGQGAYSYDLPNYGRQSADFAHTLLDWDNMPDQPTAYSPDVQRIAVATLMYVCGVGLEMQYNVSSIGSSAAGLAGVPGIHSIDNSLKDYFHYSQDMQVITKSQGFTDATWRAALIEELDRHHPIVYTGSATQGGHGFVCDGYDSRQYMHFNFGWSGRGDGYFPVDSISPGVGGVGGNVTYTFNLLNQALIGAVPDYALRASDSVISFASNGGSDSVLVGINPNVDAPVHIAVDASWVTLGSTSIDGAGWLTFSVQPFDGSDERNAVITVTQGSEVARIRIVQINYSPDEMCPLTVVMESTNGNGWNDNARLTLESASGYVFGTAHLAGGSKDSLTIMVAPKDVYSVWHSGGGTDRYIKYFVRNQYGEDFVSVEYAYRDGGTDLIPWPCGHVSTGDIVSQEAVVVCPNPASETLNVKCNNLIRVEIYDLQGRLAVSSSSDTVSLGTLPSGNYIARIVSDGGIVVKHFVKK